MATDLRNACESGAEARRTAWAPNWRRKWFVVLPRSLTLLTAVIGFVSPNALAPMIAPRAGRWSRC